MSVRVLITFVSLFLSTACMPRVLVVGMDGTGWEILQPLMDGGYVPTLEKLAREGATSDLYCVVATGVEETSCFCPPVWGSIVTGRPSAQHRLWNFGTRSYERNRPVFWDVVNAYGGRSNLFSLHNTWPPDPTADVVLTEPAAAIYAHTFFDVGNLVGSGVIFDSPETWTKPSTLLDDLGVLPYEGERPSTWKTMGKDRVAMMVLEAFAKRRYDEDKMNEWYWPSGVPEFDFILLHSTDRQMHMSWKTIQRFPGDPIDVDRLYELADAWTGPLNIPPPWNWGSAPSQIIEIDRWLEGVYEYYDYVIVISDHGMEPNPDPDGFPPGTHGYDQAFDGIFIAYGPGVIKPGVTLGRIDLFDVVPLFAYLMGIPIAEDLPGRFLEEAIDELALEVVPPQYVDTWDHHNPF